MSAESAPPGSIVQVTRMNVRCLVPREHPSPTAVRAKLVSLAERQLQSACANLLGPLCPENDPSVWFIRRVDADVTVDGGWGEDQLASAWSQTLAYNLVRTISNGED